MPVFKYNNGSSVPNQITLVEGDKLTLKLDGQPHQGQARHFIIKSSDNAIVEVKQNANPKIREQKIVIAAHSTGPAAILRAYGPVDDAEAVCKGVPDLACVPTVSVTVVPRITLPPEDTDEGILARLLLAESLSPERRDAYGDGEDVLKAMRKMRIVLENRLKAAQASTALKSYVACTPETMNFRGIIFANQCGGRQQIQFEGFSGNQIHTVVLGNINNMVSSANNGTHQKFKLFRRHVEEAIAVAMGPNLDNELLSSASLLYWRTEGASTPSKWAVLKETIAGQKFYSLTEGYLKNPDHPDLRP